MNWPPVRLPVRIRDRHTWPSATRNAHHGNQFSCSLKGHTPLSGTLPGDTHFFFSKIKAPRTLTPYILV